MQMILNRSKFLLLVLLSFSLTSFFFGTDNNFFYIDGSFDNNDSNFVADTNTAPLTPIATSPTPNPQGVSRLGPVVNSSKPIVVPTPAKTIVTTTTHVTSFWSQLRSEFKMDHHLQSPKVQKEIHALLADKQKLNHILRASAPYIYYINQQVQARKMPAEITLIPVIESEFDPHDHSTKGASGLWQLMPQTARDLGIKMHRGYDGRQDVVKSTKAALAFFNDLQHTFKGDWDLVLAAYNSGEGTVEHAERRAGSHSYWNLPLPRETKVYVPKLLAVAAIIQDPKKYGVVLPAVSNQPYFAVAKVTKTVNFTQLAKVSGVDSKVLQVLNPEYKKGSAPNKGTTVLVPLAVLPQARSAHYLV